jgi:hypothetical protein
MSKLLLLLFLMLPNNYQAEAQWEANYMAQRGIKGHVGRTIADFEGCGWSSHGTPPTCVPPDPWRYHLVADAIAQGRDGQYRVRAWKRIR